MIDYSLRYGYAETLQLPYPHRVYFDSGADEWNDCPLKQKLLDLGYVTTMGYDITRDVNKILKEHSHISEESIRHSLSLLLSELLGKGVVSVESRYEGVSAKDMADDLKEYLTWLYILPFDASDHYLISPERGMTDKDILAANHWNIVAEIGRAHV